MADPGMHPSWPRGAHQALWLLLALTLSLGVLRYAQWEADRQERTSLDSFGARINDLAQISSIIIADRLREYDNSLLVLRDAYAAAPEGIAGTLDLLRKGPLADRELLVVVTDSRGALAFTDAPNVAPRLFLGDRAYFRFFAEGGRDRLYVDEPVFGRVTKRYTLPLARPVYGTAGTFLGVVAISVTQASLGDLSPTLTLADDTVVTVVNRGGAIVTCSRDLEQVQGRSVPPEQLLPMLTARAGYLVRRQASGAEAMVAYRSLDDLPLMVMVTASPVAVLHAAARQRTILMACAAGIAVVIMALMLVDLQRRRMGARYIEAQRANLLAESDARLRTIVQNIPCMVWLKDPNGVYLNCNPMVERFFGAKEADIVGRTDFDLVDKEQAEAFRARDAKVMAAGESSRDEEWVIFADDGHKALLETVNTPLLDATGATTGVLGIATDVTEQKASQEALRRQLAVLTEPEDNTVDIRFADLFNLHEIQRIQDTFAQATGVASIIATPEGAPITRPSNFCRLCREVIRTTEKGLANCLKSDAVLGRYSPTGPIIQPCMSGGLWAAGASLAVGGRHVANWLIGQVRNEELDETRMLAYADEIGVDRDLFRQAWSEVPVMSSGQFAKVAQALYSLANELSAKAYQNLRQARFIAEHNALERELQEKNRELERFTYTVSHDLKSPLITIQAFAGQVVSELAAGRHENIANDLARISKAAVRMGQLLGDLLELSRVGRMRRQPSLVDMNEVIDEALAQLAGRIRERQVEVRVVTDLPRRMADRQQMVMVWQNLLENAIKYMGAQPAPRIDIGARAEGTETAFFLRDNGLGIEPRFHEEIFGLFRKLDPNSEGTGIGLGLVRRSIEVNGGRVWVESAGPGTGCTFCFTLPGAGSMGEGWEMSQS